MKRSSVSIMIVFFLVAFLAGAALADAPVVTNISVEGNSHVVTRHILGVIGAKAGASLDRQQVEADIEAIYGLGFFSFVDAKVRSDGAGVALRFIVRENPVVKEVRFTGNTVYSEEDLLGLVFTASGSVFNRVFFRHDLERIKEKYQKDGYVMMKIRDVQTEGGIISVSIVEPRVGDIIIQGNTKTKTYVIERQFKLKRGDLFNSKVLRSSLKKIQGLGYFEDVNVGFEPAEDPDMVNIILTVKDQKTGSVSFSVSYGSSSRWGGGLTYGDSNLNGRGQKFETGFELGDEESYWVSLADPYMDEETYAWKASIYKRSYEDREYWDDDNPDNNFENVNQFDYNEEVYGTYFGVGKKFRGNPKLSWYVTLDWHKTEISNIEAVESDSEYIDWHRKNVLRDGKNLSLTADITRNNLDEYLSYRKGDVETLSVEKAFDALGADWDYTKYWLTSRFYVPIHGFGDFFDFELGKEDNPVIFASRIKAGSSSGEVPWAESYSVGGAKTLRGYDGGQFRGDEMFLANMEFRIPVQDAFSVVFFYDMGNAWGGIPYMSSDTGNFDLGDLHDGYGIGLRVKTPLGNIRLDHAEGDFETKTHFGFGEVF